MGIEERNDEEPLAHAHPACFAGALLSLRVLPEFQRRKDFHRLEGLARPIKDDFSIQDCPEPSIRPGHVIHDQAYAALRGLHMDYARIQPWFPYPKLGVAELDPPSNGKTHWDFAGMDPLVMDFYNAAEGRPIVLSFSAIPEWMVRTDALVAYPADPDEIDFNYDPGTELRDPSLKEVVGYYERLYDWYTNGGFTDEAGVIHKSGHHLHVAYWEVLNEIDMEHRWSPEQYTRIYDAIVTALRAKNPTQKFIGLALTNPVDRDHQPYFEYFLNLKNHAPGIPLDAISYHYYVGVNPDDKPETLQAEFFKRADVLIEAVKKVEAVRKRLSPSTKTYIDELGTMWMNGEKADNPPIPDHYWTLGSSVFAYMYLGLVRQGIDIIGAAELIDYPGQFAGTTLLDWNTGKPNARFLVTDLLHKTVKPGDTLHPTASSSTAAEAQAFSNAQGKTLVLINKTDAEVSLEIEGAAGTSMTSVDQTTGSNPPSKTVLNSNSVVLEPQATAVLAWPAHSK